MPHLRFAFRPVALGTFLLIVGACTEAGAPPPDSGWALRSETTGFRETASYAEVVAYLEQAAAAHPSLHLTRFGYTNEGRALPLLVAGPVAEATPAAIRRAGVPVVYLQGNIHAGEVAGKEALLRLVRGLAAGERDDVLDELVLLVGPIYNADGNERVDLGNRPRQHGPVGGMGTRANAQGLDLNRDQMKLDSPEARSLARLLTDFDPHVLVDLHTTNGTRHAYHLTYSPPLHPATPAAIDELLRDRLLPRVTAALEEGYGWHYWHYGNVSQREGVRGWYTFDHRPRFVTNYAGLRNRIGILSEAYSYATFEDRVLATERFVGGILEWVRAHPDDVVGVVEAEDARRLVGARLPVRAGFPDQAPTHPILMGDVGEEAHPWTGRPILRRLDVVNEEPMPAFVSFVGTEVETVPAAYLLPPSTAPLVERLRAHGIRVEEGADRVRGVLAAGELQRFQVRSVEIAQQPFQGRHETTVEGAWVPDPGGPDRTELAQAGWFVVSMDQPLSRLAFLLLEPRADDGFLNWGLLAPWIEEGAPYPARRIVE